MRLRNNYFLNPLHFIIKAFFRITVDNNNANVFLYAREVLLMISYVPLTECRRRNDSLTIKSVW